MNSLANKAVSAAYTKLGRVNDLLNGPDPRFVSYRENGKDKKIENLNLDSAHCRSFIGKMKLDGSGTYSDEVITVLLKYFLDHTKKGEKIVIELANKVSELLNGEGAMDGHMDFETQKKYILDLAKDLDKKRINDVEIVDIQDTNRRLFDVLEKEGLSGLHGNFVLPNFETPFDSLDIAKYLYQLAKQDPKYLEEIKSLKSEEFRQINGDSDYYGLVEMAIRINALLHGITLQGGVARQKKYDALLLKHINPYVKDFPLLSDFQTACREKLKGESFNGLYFDTQESEKMIGKLEKRDEIRSKARNALLILLTTGTLFSGGKFVEHTIQEKKQKATTEQIIKEISETKKLTWYGDMGFGIYEGKLAVEYIHRYINDIYDRFLLRYGSTGELSEIAFKAKIADRINNQEVLDLLGSPDDISPVEDLVIDKYIVQPNKGELETLGINTVPYAHYIQYTDAFVNTLLLEKDFGSSWEESIGEFNFLVKDIGAYSAKYQGGYASSIYLHELGKITQNGKDYILATPTLYAEKFDKLKHTTLYSSHAKDLAIDFLRQTQPVIEQVLDQYLLRYYRYYGNSLRMNDDGSFRSEKETLPMSIIELLLKDFLKKGLLKKIEKDDIQKITTYLDSFVLENSKSLHEIDPNVNENIFPNGFLFQYESIMKNTVDHCNDQEIHQTNSKYITPYRSAGEKDYILEDLVSKYMASDGKTYFVGITEVDGQKYLCAREEFPSDYYQGRYYTLKTGEIVARDYFKTKAKFMEAKILREKQEKSVSKRHVDQPRNFLKNNSNISNYKPPKIPLQK